MGASAFLVDHCLPITGGLLAVIVGALCYFRTDRGREMADHLRLNLPLLGPMYRKACLVRMLRTLGSMISAGVSVLDAVLITRDVVGNRVFGRMLEDAHDKLQHGEQLSQALLDAPYIPRPVWQMLHAGERTGNLGPAMDRVANLCEGDLNHAIRGVTQFIEPAMILVVGSIVGGIALAMLLPVFQISKIMSQ
jgi:type IV pilus assembly protein PilC